MAPPSILAMDFVPSHEEKNYCNLNFANLYDNIIKKLVSEIRKCRQLHGTSSLGPLTIICWLRHAHMLAMYTSLNFQIYISVKQSMFYEKFITAHLVEKFLNDLF